MKFEVGQPLWFVPCDGRATPYRVVIEAVGRKWLRTSHGMHVNMHTLWVDGGQYSSPGRCYLSKAEHDAEAARTKAWQDFRKLVSDFYSPPRDMTVEKIREVRRILFNEPCTEPQPATRITNT